MRRHKKCPEFENHERWLVAFADMMTLLFALFVVLYALKDDGPKIKKAAESIRMEFGIRDELPVEEGPVPRGPANIQSIFRYLKGNTSREQLLQRIQRERAVIIAADAKKLEQKIAERLYGAKQFPSTEKAPQDRIVHIARDPDGIRVTLLARQFFKTSRTDMTIQAKKILHGMADILKGLGRIVRVEGHTDNRPFRKDGMTNWELSALRATEVVRYFVEHEKFKPGEIYSAGYADTRPIAINDTPEDRAMNRRIDLKILYDQPGDYIPPDVSLTKERSFEDEP